MRQNLTDEPSVSFGLKRVHAGQAPALSFVFGVGSLDHSPPSGTPSQWALTYSDTLDAEMETVAGKNFSEVACAQTATAGRSLCRRDRLLCQRGYQSNVQRA